MTDDEGSRDHEDLPDREAEPNGEREPFRRHWETVREAPRPPDRSGGESRLRRLGRVGWSWGRPVAVALALLAVAGGVLFAVAGTWPLVVGVESGSMEPNIAAGDLVVLTAPDRFAPAAADTELGVVTYAGGRERGYRSFGSYGSVIVFRKPNATGAVIHRVHFRVEAGENWVRRANDSHLRGEDCEAVQYCPAPHDGFITKGDANPTYDQASGLVPPVRSAWVTGVARFRVPLG